jgi:hypothetical protein
VAVEAVVAVEATAAVVMQLAEEAVEAAETDEPGSIAGHMATVPTAHKYAKRRMKDTRTTLRTTTYKAEARTLAIRFDSWGP